MALGGAGACVVLVTCELCGEQGVLRVRSYLSAGKFWLSGRQILKNFCALRAQANFESNFEKILA